MKTTAFRIDDAVPIPPRKGKPAGYIAPDWPFATLEIGQSIFSEGFSLRLKTAAQEFKMLNPPWDYTSHIYDIADPDPVTGKPGLRIWRTA
jgi:hypothetical protein